MAYKFRLGRADLSGSMTTDDIMFSEDEDTGIDFDSDTIKLMTNSATRFTVSNTGLKASLDVTVDTNAEPAVQFKEDGNDRAEIKINDSDNLLITNQSTNKHIVFKTNDAGTVREGLRVGGTTPEVVVNEGSDSLVDFRVESNNRTHMLFVDGGNNKVGIATNQPEAALDINSDSIRLRNSNTPSSASDFGFPGEIRWDANYIYVCVATDTWKRVALSTW